MARQTVPKPPAGRGPTQRPDPALTRRAFSLRFVSETIAELKKVTWPTRKETTRLSFLVILISGTVGVILGLIDLGFSRMFGRFF